MQTEPRTAATPKPKPLPPPSSVRLPEPLGYRLKNKLLGPPLNTDQLGHERLGRPTALAVFASRQPLLVGLCHRGDPPGAGAGHRRGGVQFVVPITVGMLVVLGLLILSYRETIKEYPTRRRSLCRHQATTSASCRRKWQAYRCSPTTSSRWRCRWLPAPPRLASAIPGRRAVQGADLDRVHRRSSPSETSRSEGIRQGVRRPDVLLHREHGRPSRPRSVQDVDRATCRSRRQPAGAWCTSALRATGCSWERRCS